MKNPLESSIAIVILSLCASGCSGWIRGEGGFTTSTTFNSGRQGGSLGAEIAAAPLASPIAVDVALRGKVTPKAGDGMLYLGLWHLRPPAPVAGFYALGGANILQIGSADGDFSFGMFSPVAEVGLTINASKEIAKGLPLLIPAMVTVGARIEYALRFTHQPHEGFLTLNVGYAVGIGPN